MQPAPPGMAPAPLQPPPPQMGAAAPPARPGAGPGTGSSRAAPTPAPAPGRMPGGPGGMAANAEQLLGKFQALSMGPVGPAAPGQPQQNVSIDPNEFPRPTGPQVDQLLGPQETDPLACDPRHVRMTVHAVPQSAELRKRWQLPYGAIIHPMAKLEEPVPVVSFGAAGVLRCRRCRAYINPYVQFLDGGRRWACNFCGQPNDVPVEYFCALDHQGKRKDLAERPELLRGAVEFVAPAEYMVRPPMPPTYVFLIDVSHAAVVSGAVHTALQGIKANLDRLPGDTRTQVGFVTFDSTVHFYQIRQGASGPAMLVASDLEDMFLPTPEDLVVNLSENREAVEATIDTIGKAFEGSQKSESCLGAALQGAFLAMEKVGGKLQLFCTSPATKGPGKMKPGRDNSSLYGGEKEHTLRCPDDPFWRNFGTECSKNQISVDVFCSAGQFTDVASIAGAAHWSGGQAHPHGQGPPRELVPRARRDALLGPHVPAHRRPGQGVRRADRARRAAAQRLGHLHAVCPAVHLELGRAPDPGAHAGHPHRERPLAALQGRRRRRQRGPLGAPRRGEGGQLAPGGRLPGGAAQDGRRAPGVPHDVLGPAARAEQAGLPREPPPPPGALPGGRQERGPPRGLEGRHAGRARGHGLRGPGHGRRLVHALPLPPRLRAAHHRRGGRQQGG